MNPNRGMGVSNFNGGCDPDVVSGSLPYLECLFTKTFLLIQCCEARSLATPLYEGLMRLLPLLGFMCSWKHI